MLEIKAIGIGGIGCALLPFLCRYLQYSGEPARLTLIDGDRFEPGNAARQAFSHLGNKAEVKSRELAREFEALAFRSAPEYVTEDNVARLIGEGEMVFLMVDNHASRHLVSRHVSSLADLTLISGGNDEEDGNVQVYVRREGRDLTPSLARYHPGDCPPPGPESRRPVLRGTHGGRRPPTALRQSHGGVPDAQRLLCPQTGPLELLGSLPGHRQEPQPGRVPPGVKPDPNLPVAQASRLCRRRSRARPRAIVWYINRSLHFAAKGVGRRLGTKPLSTNS